MNGGCITIPCLISHHNQGLTSFLNSDDVCVIQSNVWGKSRNVNGSFEHLLSEQIGFYVGINRMNPMYQMGRAPFNLAPTPWAPPPLPSMPPPSSSFWTGANVSSRLKELHDTINLAKAM